MLSKKCIPASILQHVQNCWGRFTKSLSNASKARKANWTQRLGKLINLWSKNAMDKNAVPIGSPWLAVKNWWWTAVQSCLTSHKTWCGHNFWILNILTQMWILNSIDSYISGLHRSSIVLQFCQTCFFFNVCSPSSAPVQQVLEQIHAGPPSWIGPRLKQHRCCWMRLEDFVQQKTGISNRETPKTFHTPMKRKKPSLLLMWLVISCDGKRWCRGMERL